MIPPFSFSSIKLNSSAHSPIGVRGVGVGLGFTKDEIGPSDQSRITAVFSYTLPINEQGTKLAFGVQGGLSLLDVNPAELNIYNPNDYDLQLNHFAAPVFGVGLFLYDKKWYVGLSAPSILQTKYYDEVQVSTATERVHYYLTGGYVFDLNPNLKFKPAAMLKGTVGAPLSVDVSANFLLYNKLTLGAAYRWDAAVSAIAGFQINRNLMIGYAYDYSTTELGHYNNGSHEIFLRFELGTKVAPKVNPRFF